MARPAARLVSIVALGVGLAFGSSAAPPVETLLDATPPFTVEATALADLDGDGAEDVVIASADGAVAWYAASDGVVRTISAGGGTTLEDFDVADVDGDGDRDVVLANGVWLESPATGGDIFLDPFLAQSYGADAGRGVVVADVDGDLDLDVVRRSDDGASIRIHLQGPIGSWTEALAVPVPTGRGFAVADLDEDGHMDLVLGDRWLANPIDLLLTWTESLYTGAPSSEAAFRIAIGDIDGDTRDDVVVAPREGAGIASNLRWFQTPADPRTTNFLETIVEEDIEDSVDALALMDWEGDGDLDLVTALLPTATLEPAEIRIGLNTGGNGASWGRQVVATRGARMIDAGDTDGDGDPDFIDLDPTSGELHAWENVGSARGAIAFTRLSTDNGDLELPNLGGGQQTAALILDIDGDALNDFVIAERTASPSMVWYQRTITGWARHVIDTDVLDIEAGGDFADIDGDGDLDVAMGGDSNSDEVWWWENPAPNFDPATPWTRHLIKASGGNQHHDMIFGDFDGDGDDELIYWNRQPSSQLMFAEIPADPKAGPWPAVSIFAGVDAFEGLASADVDGNGVLDVVGGGRWFSYVDPTTFTEHVVDPAMNFTRAAVGQLVPGGRPEIVFVIGDSKASLGYDGIGPIRWYQWDGATWVGNDLLPFPTDHGHSLDIVDFNRDGHLDIFNAEMNLEGNDDAAVRIFLGDGAGGFTLQVVSEGIGNHESKIGDLDGDADLDILGKPFQTESPGLNVWLNQSIDPGVISLDLWRRHSIDPAQPWLSVYALPGDLDGDGETDIAAGGWWYRNPGRYSDPWVRTPIGDPFNNVAMIRDFDGDGDLDLLGTPGQTQAPIHPGDPNLKWARNDGNGQFTVLENITPGVATGPDDAFIQGIVPIELVPGQPEEILLSWNFGEFGESGIDLLTIPADPSTTTWPLTTIHPFSEGEEIQVGDLDLDGDPDIFQGSGWLRNEGDGSWTRFESTPLIGGNAPYDDADRVQLADLDGDGDLDAVIGLLFETSSIPVDLVWLENPADPTGEWPLHVIASGIWGVFSLDVSDMDNDGDYDVTVGEHVGLTRLLVFENLGDPFSWAQHVVDPGGPGIDHHDGAVTHDFDGDGDLDILSLGWTNQNVWLWENRAAIEETFVDSLPPTPATNLVATAFASSKVDLTWDRASDNQGIAYYEIHRDDALVATTTELFFRDLGLTESTAYDYTVFAVDVADNVSETSNVASVTTAPYESDPPSVPPNFVLNALPTRIVMTWTPSTDNVAVIGYRIFRDGVEIATLPASATEFIVEGLLPGTSGDWAISAYDAEDNASDPLVTTSTLATTAPPSGAWLAYGFEDDPLDDFVADDSGNLNHGEAQNGAILGAPGRSGAGLELLGSSGNVDLGGLDIHSAAFTIACWINADSFDTDDARIVSKSTGSTAADHLWMISTVQGPHLRFRLRTDDGVTTTLVGDAALAQGAWIHAAVVYDGAEMRIYQDGVLVGTTAKSGAVDIDPAVEAWIGANPGESKQVFDGRIDEFKIFGRALTRAEIVLESSLPVAIVDAQPPTVPANPVELSYSTGTLEIGWDPSTENSGLPSYRVFRDGVEIATTVEPRYLDTGLVDGVTYAYTISAFDGSGNESAQSTAAILMARAIVDMGPPTAPQGLAAAGTMTGVTLTWLPSTDDIAVTGYRVEQGGIEIAAPTTTTLVIDPIAGGIVHQFEVFAVDGVGNVSAPSATLEFVLDSGPPTAPPGVAGVVLPTEKVRLTWNASTDDGTIDAYVVKRDGLVIATLDSTAREFIDGGASPDTTHSYAMSAIDGVGYESVEATILVVTPPSILAPDVVGAWSFETESAGVVPDVSGHGNDGTLQNGARLESSGRFGSALEVLGGPEHFDLGGLDVPGSGLTLMLWLNADDFDVSDARLVSKAVGTAEADHYWMLSTVGGSQARFRLRTDDGSTSTLVGAAVTPLAPGVWIHVAATYDGAEMRLYQDGALVGSLAKTGAIATDPTVAVHVGANPAGDPRPFDGRIDDLRIYNRALSLAEIQTEMVRDTSTLAPTPVAPQVPIGPATPWLVLLGLGLTASRALRAAATEPRSRH